MTTAVQLQLERDPVVHAGDVVRWTQKRGRTTKVYFARVSSAGYLAHYSLRSTLWLTFAGARVRCYDFSAVIGPETSYSVAIGKLARVSRAPVTLRRVSLAGLRAAVPAHTAS